MKKSGHSELVFWQMDTKLFPWEKLVRIQHKVTTNKELNKSLPWTLESFARTTADWPNTKHTQTRSLAHPGPSSMEMYRGRERRAGQRSAASQRSRTPSGQRLRFVWSSGGALILTQGSARRPAHSRSTLGGRRRSWCFRPTRQYNANWDWKFFLDLGNSSWHKQCHHKFHSGAFLETRSS